MRPGKFSIIIDHAGNSFWFAHPARYTPPPLDVGDGPAGAKRGAVEIKNVACPKCERFVDVTETVCPYCDAAMDKAVRPLPREDRRAMSISALAESIGMSKRTLANRLAKMSLAEALAAPHTPRLPSRSPAVMSSLHAIVSRQIFEARLKCGWNEKDAAQTPSTYGHVVKLSRAAGTPARMVYRRLARGWSLEKALHHKSQYGQLAKLARKAGVPLKRVCKRLQDGWSLRDALRPEKAKAGRSFARRWSA